MSNNTNTLFWVITGAVIILATFLLFQTGGNDSLSNITRKFGGMFNGNPELAKYYGHEKNYSSLSVTDEDLFGFDEATQTITEYYGKDTDVVFPYEINGIEVKAIDDLKLSNKANYAENCLWLQQYYNNAPDDEKEWLIYELQWYEEMGIIKDGVCQEMPRLTSVVIPNTVEVIKDYAFGYNQDLVSVTLPTSIRSIGRQAFYQNAIESVDLSKLNSLTTIGEYAFAYNNIGGELVIPDSVTSMGYEAFGYNNIDHAIISKNLSNLNYFMFYNNQNMKYVKFNNPRMSLSETISSSKDNTFNRDSSFIIKVPSGSRSWYANIFAKSSYKIEEF